MGITAVLLPGLDGTGRMFAPFIAQLPSWMRPVVIAYPTDRALDYAQLLNTVLPQLPDTAPYVLIAESFAGPLALQISTHANANLKALVLCASFVRNPRPHLAKLAPLLLHEQTLAYPPQKWMARLFVTGFDVPDWMLKAMLEIHKQVSPSVILKRLHEVIQVDVSAILRDCAVPVLHLYALHDHLIMQRPTRDIQRLRPDIESIGIDGPHYLLQTRPQQCAKAITEFLLKNGIVSGDGDVATKPGGTQRGK